MKSMKKFTAILCTFAAGVFVVLSAQEVKKAEEKTPAPVISPEATAPVAKETVSETPVKAPEVTAPVAKEAVSETPVPPPDAESAVKTADASIAQVDEKIQKKEEEEKARPQSEEKPSYKSCVLIRHVIVTADYGVPRLLAETAREELGVPCMVIPGDGRQPDPSVRIAFFTPKAEKPLLIPARDLSKFLAYLRPRNVVFLGNTDYIPAFYRAAVPSVSKLILVSDADWHVNAEKLSSLLQSRKPFAAYRNFRQTRAAELKAKREALRKAQQTVEKAESELIEAEMK